MDAGQRCVFELFLRANINTNGNTIIQNRQMQMSKKFLLIFANVFENTKTNTFQILLIYMKILIYYIVI